jgi:thioredoxin 2
MAPEYEKAAKAMEPRARFLKLNSDDEQQVSARLGIRGIPTMLLFNGGEEVGRVSGAMPSEQIQAWLKERIAV